MLSCTHDTEQSVSFPPICQRFFEFKLFWHAEWLAVYRGFGYWCIRNTSVSEARVCLFMCVSASVKTKRQSSEYFHSSTLPLPRAACQCWPLKRAGTRSRREANTHKCTRTCSVSERSCRLRGSRLQRFRAGATTVHTHLPSGSEAVLYTCQPSSEPGYSPCTQTRPVLMKSLRDNTLPDERVSRGKHRKQNRTKHMLGFCFQYCWCGSGFLKLDSLF